VLSILLTFACLNNELSSFILACSIVLARNNFFCKSSRVLCIVILALEEGLPLFAGTNVILAHLFELRSIYILGRHEVLKRLVGQDPLPCHIKEIYLSLPLPSAQLETICGAFYILFESIFDQGQTILLRYHLQFVTNTPLVICSPAHSSDWFD